MPVKSRMRRAIGLSLATVLAVAAVTVGTSKTAMAVSTANAELAFTGVLTYSTPIPADNTCVSETMSGTGSAAGQWGNGLDAPVDIETISLTWSQSASTDTFYGQYATDGESLSRSCGLPQPPNSALNLTAVYEAPFSGSVGCSLYLENFSHNGSTLYNTPYQQSWMVSPGSCTDSSGKTSTVYADISGSWTPITFGPNNSVTQVAVAGTITITSIPPCTAGPFAIC